MGYIKKLKNNELVGGTDKTTIYPVTSTEAVFEEVIEDGESNFKSQKFLNNNITGDRINEGTITDYNIATGTITKGKLSSQVQTMLDEGQKKALTPKGDYNPETEYEALDLVFDRDSNSSYVSLITPNTEPLTNEDAWEMFLDGTAVNTAQATINDKVDVLDAQVDEAIGQAQQDVRDLIDETAAALQAATDEANNAAGEARDAASTVETLTAQQVADAQIGYFTCTNTAASGAADNETKITTTDTIGVSTYTKTVGSHVKVKMAVANTHAAPVYLQFGSNTANKAQLYYNGEPASNSNSWDAGETISVYYDGTYYQASNVQGGGGNKKRLVPSASTTGKRIATNGTSIGAVQANDSWVYIKYAVREGDVVSIRGTAGATYKLWAIADSNNVILDSSRDNATEENCALVMPENAAWIVINNQIVNYPNYEWYLAKGGTLAAHEMMAESYLYGNKKLLMPGRTYAVDDPVFTTDRQLLKITKDISSMNIVDEVAVGDLKTYGTSPNAAIYQAQKAVNAYSDTTYSENDFALGSPAGAVIQVTIDSETVESLEEAVDIVVTIAGIAVTVSVDSESQATSIATDIYTEFGTQEEWKLTDNNDGTLTLISKVAKDTAPTISSQVGESGVTVGFETGSSYSGSTALSKFDGSSWSVATLANYAADAVPVGDTDATKMWKILTLEDVISIATTSDFVPKLYNDFGDDVDGALTQNFVTNYIKKVTETEPVSATLTVGKGILANIDTAGTNFGTWENLSKNTFATTSYINVRGYDYIKIYTTIASTSNLYGDIYGGVFYKRTPRTYFNAIKEGQHLIKLAATADAGWVTLPIPKGAVYFSYTTNSSHNARYILGKIEYIWDNVRKLEDCSQKYVLTDVPRIATNKVYKEGDSVRYEDLALKITKPVKYFDLNEAVDIDDLRVYGGDTYRCITPVAEYSTTVAMTDPSYPYANNAFAKGRPTVYTFTVSAGTITPGDVILNVNDTNITTITITSEMSIDDVIDAIVSQLTTDAPNWVVTNSNNSTTFVAASKIGDNIQLNVSLNGGNTGISLTSSHIEGSTYVSRYNSSTKKWSAATELMFIAASDYYQPVHVETIVELATAQDSRYSDLNNRTTRTITSNTYTADTTGEIDDQFYYTVVSDANFGKTYTKGGSFRMSNFIYVKGHTAINIYARVSSSNTSYYNKTGALFFDENKVPIRYNTYVITSEDGRIDWYKLTIPANAVYLKVFKADTDTVRYYFEDVQTIWDIVENISVEADASLDKTSLNPIQNKVVANALSEEIISDDIFRQAMVPYTNSDSSKPFYNTQVESIGFIHFSDVHSDAATIADIKKYKNKYAQWVTDVIQTGDAPEYYYTDLQGFDWMPESLYVLGNHDGAYNSNEYNWQEGSADWDYMGKAWDFNTYFAPYIQNRNITMPVGYNIPGHANENACFWHKDYPEGKLRVVGLDCMHYYDGVRFLTNEQETWLTALLNETLNSSSSVYRYGVVFLSHYALDDFSGANAEWDEAEHKFIYNSSSSGGYAMNRSTGQATYFHSGGSASNADPKFCWRVKQPGSGANYSKSIKTNTNGIGDIIEAWRQNGGNYIAWLCGHRHLDYVIYPTKYPHLLNIGIAVAGTTRSDNNLNHTREDGTEGHTVANFISFNASSNLIKIIRLGSRRGANMKPIRCMCINSQTGVISYDGY
jgi:hypothetical protein